MRGVRAATLAAALCVAAAGAGRTGAQVDAPTQARADAPAGAPADARVDGTIEAARVDPPKRAFGLALGDVLVQRVHLDGRALAGGTIDGPIDGPVGGGPVGLPGEGRVDRWLERLSAHVIADGDGGGALELRYRIVNSPEAPAVARLPGLELALDGGGALAVAPWPFAFGPLAPESAVREGVLPAMRPDRLPPAPDPGPLEARLRLALAALGATLALWLGWWLARRARDAVRLPFARAARRLRALPRAGRDERPEAWATLHRAIDRTAGTTVHAGSIDALVRAAPWSAPWRERVARFYAASGARFFAEPPRPEPFEVTALCAELERAERGHARGRARGRASR